MIILRTPKGWTGPKEVDGLKTEGILAFAPGARSAKCDKPGHIKLLEEWMRSYRPEELFDETGALRPEIAALAPKGERRMGANPHANGGLLLRDLDLPDFADYAVKVDQPGERDAEATRGHGRVPARRDEAEPGQRNFRVFGPDETASNRLTHVFEVTDRVWMARASCRRTITSRRTAG